MKRKTVVGTHQIKEICSCCAYSTANHSYTKLCMSNKQLVQNIAVSLELHALEQNER